MLRFLLLSFFSVSTVTAFVPNAPLKLMSQSTSSCIRGKKSGDDEVVNQQAFAVGSFIEFVEKSRTHIGKIESVEHKSSGGARYQ